MNIIIKKSDGIGALASSICLIHCAITPFIFIAQACSSSCCESTPYWWRWIDYLFLVIAFFAVYQSAKTTSNKIIPKLLWISWSALFMIIINENLQFLSLPTYAIYIPAISLIILHTYNRKYCHCDTDQCETTIQEKK